MKLEINQKIVAENADAEAIKDALRVLNQGAEAFITLWESEDIFLQAAGVPQTGYMMSYRNRQTGEELISKNQALKPQAVMRTMTSYARGNWDWRNTIGWQPTGEYAARTLSRGSALRRGLPIYVALLFFIVAIAPLVMGTKWVAEQAVFKGMCEQNGDGKFAHYEHGGGDDITVSYSPPRCWYEDGKNIDFHTIVGSNADMIDAVARTIEVIAPLMIIALVEVTGLLLWWRGRKHGASETINGTIWE